VRSLLVIGVTATVFVVFLVRNERSAQAIVRAEDAAVERLGELVAKPPAPPHVEGGFRFEWADEGDLPPLLLARPEEGGPCLFAAPRGGGIYAFDLIGRSPPDVTSLRIHVARATEDRPLPAGWRKIR